MTHDYTRNGTVDLFAAMNVATGEMLQRPAARTPAPMCWRSSGGSTSTSRVISTASLISTRQLEDAIDVWASHWNHDPNRSCGPRPSTTSPPRSNADQPPSISSLNPRHTTRTAEASNNASSPARVATAISFRPTTKFFDGVFTVS